MHDMRSTKLQMLILFDYKTYGGNDTQDPPPYSLLRDWFATGVGDSR